MTSTPPPPPPEPPPVPTPGGAQFPQGGPTLSPTERVRNAYAARAQSDYYFSGPGVDILLSVLTCGIWALYLFYQLMRRSRDHNRRRLELLDATTALAWERANAQGAADELRPNFERIAAQLGVLRALASEFRDPAIWLVIAIVASGIAQIVGFIFIDGDLVKHDSAEVAIESDLAAIFNRLGMSVPGADPSRVQQPHNYVGRVIATVASCGVYHFWWLYNMMDEGNRHLETNWAWEDALVASVPAINPAG
jgi:hypothetical protein